MILIAAGGIMNADKMFKRDDPLIQQYLVKMKESEKVEIEE